MNNSNYKQYLTKLKASSRYRILQSYAGKLVNFSHNDYLGLAKHPEMVSTAQKYAAEYGVGATSSRLLSGNFAVHEEAEEFIAKCKKKQAAMVFPSGYQANLTVIQALLNKSVLGTEPLVFCDRLNHASMHAGCQLAGVRQIRYHHLDLNHLEKLLIKHTSSTAPKFILTETVFGMDGDILDMQGIIYLAQKYGCFLYFDEAHATGLFGIEGYGLTTDYEFEGISMGTFSKALGCQGGYIACDSLMKDYLVNSAGGFIYTTAVSPMLLGAMQKSLELLPSMGAVRDRIFAMAGEVRRLLDLPQLRSQIVVVQIGNELKTLEIRDKLLSEGLLVGAIRPPTVPVGGSRLRIAINSEINTSDIEKLANMLASLK